MERVFAERDGLATFGGERLLGKEGMSAVHSLLTAHIEYGQQGELHADEITDLDAQIKDLMAARDRLQDERDSGVRKQASARHTYGHQLKEAVVSGSGNNSVYATVIRAVASDGQGKLWYPETLAKADRMGKSLVAVDNHLRGHVSRQPVLVVNREGSNHYTNLYLGRTKRRGGLEPDVVGIEEVRGMGRRIVSREALALPISDRSTHSFQIHPNSFGREDIPLDNFGYGRGPNLRDLKDSFKILLPQGSLGELKPAVYCDTDDGVTQFEIVGEGLSKEVSYAIGEQSVRQVLGELEAEFRDVKGQPNAPQMFGKVGELLLGRKLQAAH
jgi:hypothetical protein